MCANAPLTHLTVRSSDEDASSEEESGDQQRLVMQPPWPVNVPWYTKEARRIKIG